MMQWTTLYIKGKSGFKPIVLVKLKGVILHGSSLPDQDVLMVWTKGGKSLRSLKLLIGADMIFRYRLQFFNDLNGHLETKAIKGDQLLSNRERELLHKMREMSRRPRKHSAAQVTSIHSHLSTQAKPTS
jgi:hypothetical protein